MSPFRSPARSVLALLAAALLAPSSHAFAKATLMVMNADGDGEGFNDPTAATPTHGNDGTTRGEQRLIAVQHAADLWGEVLDSAVPIVIRATFDALGCGNGASAVLAQASSSGVHTGIRGDDADPNLLYPRALAERLAKRDLAPGEPDIDAFFNSSIDDANCLGGLGWYYGLDAQGGDRSDLVNTALHELGHGLGVGVFADLDTGALLQGIADVYATHVYDAKIGKHWDEMSDSERVTSVSNVRRVAWDGVLTTTAAASFLAHGAPKLGVTPAISGLSGFVADAAFGKIPTGSPAHGPLMLGDTLDGCSINVSVAAKIVLLQPACRFSAVAALLDQAGALGTLMAIGGGFTAPPLPIEDRAAKPSTIPVISISDADLQLLTSAVNAGSVTVDLSADANVLLGADDQGRVLLDVTQPVTGSSISHWDTLTRPNLLMEPIATREQPNSVDLTGPMLRDLGWAPFCGNGRVDQNEDCDDGGKNSDTTPDACRTNCTSARCGDGITDQGEDCDDGTKNDDRKLDACRSDCRAAHCGDGVKDTGEACDAGKLNSDTSPDACRSDCSMAHCGDGVTDRSEDCDDGAQNSDQNADACRSDCTAARCGDGVRDRGEDCDDGDKNSDSAQDACRSDCTRARCGDGVKDNGEACDDGARNSDQNADACRSDCTAARCGDGVTDSNEDCDDGSSSCKACKLKTKSGTQSASRAGSAADGGTPTSGDDTSKGGKRVSTSCSCNLIGASDDARDAGFALALMALCGLRLRFRRPRHQVT